MDRIFNLENPFWNFLGKLWDVVWLTLLWYLSLVPALVVFFVAGSTEAIISVLQSGSVPAYVMLSFLILALTFPVGPSTTAFFYVSQKIVQDEEGYVTKQYFHSFKMNFKQGSVIWLLMLGIGLLLGFNFYFYTHIEAAYGKPLLLVIFFCLWIYLMIMQYIFPVLSKFDNTIRRNITFAILLSIQKLGWTLLMIAIFILVFVAGLYVSALFIIFAPGIIFTLDSLIIVHIFKPIIEEQMGKDEAGKEGSGPEDWIEYNKSVVPPMAPEGAPVSKEELIPEQMDKIVEARKEELENAEAAGAAEASGATEAAGVAESAKEDQQ